MTPLLIVIVFLLGAAMAVARFVLSTWASNHPSVSMRNGFPLAVFLVNAIGSLVAGCAAGAAATGAIPPQYETVILVGIAAGLTTFSTLNVETVQLLIARRYGTAIVSVSANYVIGIAFAALGYFGVLAFT
jgi:CrcB protein